MPRSLLNEWRDAIVESELRSTPKLVALVLSSWMGAGGECFPAQDTVARRASMSDTTVRKATRVLESAGFLAVEWSKGRGSHTYQATVPTPKHLRSWFESNPEHWASNPELQTSNPEGSSDEGCKAVTRDALRAAVALNGEAAGACRGCGVGGGMHTADCLAVASLAVSI